MHEIEIRVRYAETDQMGRAYHGHYLVWCEVGRTSLLRAHGFSYAALERQGIFLPVSRLEIEYRKGVRYDERVLVQTRVVTVRSRSVGFTYTLLRAADRELVARAATELLCTDLDGRPARFPSALRAALDRLCRPDRAGAGEKSGEKRRA